ncbi:MAG: M1 family metallopeptidase [Terriglobia bacterium]
MKFKISALLFCLQLAVSLSAADLSTAPPEELLRLYQQLRSLQGSDQGAVAENAEWKRDAATFTFIDGRLTFAQPVAGHVVAAVFEGRGRIEIKPPTEIEQHQLARHTKMPELMDEFKQAVFFFTDDSWIQLQQLVHVRSGANAAAATKALADAQRKYSERFNDWWENEYNHNPLMHNLAARLLADLSDPSSHGFFLADFKAERAGSLLYQISWNRDPLFFPEASNDEEVQLIHYNLNNYSEVWAGFHLGDEYRSTTRPEHRKLLAHCRSEKIAAEISSSNRLSASTTLEYQVPGGSPRLLPLKLRGVLRISSVTDGSGKKLAFIQEDSNLDNDPWVLLAEPAAADKTYILRIDYAENSTRDSRIIFQQGPGLYYVTSRESWFPSFGALDDRTLFTLHLRSPKKYKLVATGRLVRSEKQHDMLETDWETDVPYSVVGFNYGDFVEKSRSDPQLTVTAYSGSAIPDELNGLKSALDANPNLEGQLGITSGGFNTAASAGYAAEVSLQALKLFEYYYGALPFKNISVTEQPIRGYGQSWPTLIFLPYDSLLDATTRHQLRLQDSAEAREFYNVVAVHEMAHQWWGHMVGWKTYHDEWLSEGFAEFSAGLYLRKSEPGKVRSFWDLKRKWLLDKNALGHRPVDVGPLWLGLQLPAYLEGNLYLVLVYYKGAYVMEMLRALMEDPKLREPDQRFIEMMRDFAATYASKNASTEDFRKMVEKHSGQPMDWFFNEWVYGREVPHYDFHYDLKDGGGGKTTLEYFVKQSEVSDQFTMRVPVYAHVKGQPRRLGFITIQGPQEIHGEVPLPMRPEKVTLDEFHSILCTVNQ